MRLVIRPYNLPEPDRQQRRKDSHGKNRYLDAVWEKARIVVEIDGSQHTNPLDYWEDMDRDNDLKISGGYDVLRFPAWLVRRYPAHVARSIRQALAARA